LWQARFCRPERGLRAPPDFSCCLDELAPAQVLLAVDQALEAAKDAATAVAAASAIAAMRQQAEPAGEVARPPKGRYG
jgi:hypothetical protein